MATVRVSKDIVAPVVPVFQLFTGVHLGADWREVPGPLRRAGTELTAFERNRTDTIAEHKAGVRIETTFRFEPVRGATRVIAEFACAPDNANAGATELDMEANQERVARALNHDLTDLKCLIETPSQPAYRRDERHWSWQAGHVSMRAERRPG